MRYYNVYKHNTTYNDSDYTDERDNVDDNDDNDR